MSNYTIVTGSDTRITSAQDDLIKQVKALMARGWRPIGGMVYLGTEASHGFTCHLFSQTMIMPSVRHGEGNDK